VNNEVALLLDGGFVTKRLRHRLKRLPGTEDVVQLVSEIMRHERLVESCVFRTYYYDAPPFSKDVTNPVDGSRVRLGATHGARENQSLLDSLELQPDFAVRRGTLAYRGWKLGRSAMESLRSSPRPVEASDFVPDLEQKGVDLRIGLDIATLSLKKPVSTLVLVTGDVDMVPAMKHARKEGLKVFLEIMSHNVNRELRVHADLVL